MHGWIKGLILSLLVLLIGGTSYGNLIYYGVSQMAIALFCSVIAAGAFLTLLYAIETDDARYGALIPFIALFGILVAYFGQPPFETTLALCVSVSILAVLIIQE